MPSLITENQIDAVNDPYNLENDYETKMKSYESIMVQEALNRTNGNQSAAARLLNITERHLRSRLERLGLKLTQIEKYATSLEIVYERLIRRNPTIESQRQ